MPIVPRASNVAAAADNGTLWASITADAPDFFFQAEDGIRGKLVTGVQTCALPIYVLCVFFGLGALPEQTLPQAPKPRKNAGGRPSVGTPGEGALAVRRRGVLWSSPEAASQIMAQETIEQCPPANRAKSCSFRPTNGAANASPSWAIQPSRPLISTGSPAKV